jgi:hypothetical protein
VVTRWWSHFYMQFWGRRRGMVQLSPCWSRKKRFPGGCISADPLTDQNCLPPVQVSPEKGSVRNKVSGGPFSRQGI